MQNKCVQKMLRQVFWLSGHHHFVSLPEHVFSGKVNTKRLADYSCGGSPGIEVC
jgi:hypothetical protein